MDPALGDDKILQGDLIKLSKAFETRLGVLRAAHELAQQKLIAEAKIRKQLPMDVRDLMEKAHDRGIKEKMNRQALEDAQDVSVIQSFIEGGGETGGKLERSASDFVKKEEEKKRDGDDYPEQSPVASL